MNDGKFFKALIIIVLISFFIVSITITLNGLGITKINNDESTIEESGNISQTVNVEIPISQPTQTPIKEKININTCSQSALESLPNIGEVLAKRIIENRPYKDIYELDNVKGVGEKTIEIIKEMVVCE